MLGLPRNMARKMETIWIIVEWRAEGDGRDNAVVSRLTYRDGQD